MKYNLEKELISIADLAGDKIKKNIFNNKAEWKKSNDPVTQLDRKVERYLKNLILERYLNSNFIGEEFGVEYNGGILTWYLDPIDGTKSFLKRIFETSISIAVEENNNIINSCVFDFMRNLMYLGNQQGRNLMYKNNLENGFQVVENINNTQFKDREILIDGRAEKLEDKLNNIDGIKTKKQQGSIALSMAQTAFGTYDGIAFYNPDKGNSWDVASGYHLLLCENDFEISNYFGDAFNFKKPQNGFIALRKNLPENVKEVFRNDSR
ncbi:MAG: hypothetical protein KC589_04000 [Nanoarchaeota archaeon]|nr:hypothetical protein [Nanoarchaeota archaeon]